MLQYLTNHADACKFSKLVKCDSVVFHVSAARVKCAFNTSVDSLKLKNHFGPVREAHEDSLNNTKCSQIMMQNHLWSSNVNNFLPKRGVATSQDFFFSLTFFIKLRVGNGFM